VTRREKGAGLRARGAEEKQNALILPVIARSGEGGESDSAISGEAVEPLLFPLVTHEIASLD